MNKIVQHPVVFKPMTFWSWAKCSTTGLSPFVQVLGEGMNVFVMKDNERLLEKTVSIQRRIESFRVKTNGNLLVWQQASILLMSLKCGRHLQPLSLIVRKAIMVIRKLYQSRLTRQIKEPSVPFRKQGKTNVFHLFVHKDPVGINHLFKILKPL